METTKTSNFREELERQKDNIASKRYYHLHKNSEAFKKRRTKNGRAQYKKMKKEDPEKYERMKVANREYMRKVRMKAKMLDKMAHDHVQGIAT